MKRILGEADVNALRDVAFFHHLTADQLQRLRYGKSLNHVRELLHRLEDPESPKGGYLQREALPKPTLKPFAKTPNVYTLTSKGASALREAGVEVRLSTQKRHSYIFLEHVLAINEFLIAARRFERLWNGVSIRRIEHERELKRFPFAGMVKGARKTVSSDGFVWLTCTKGEGQVVDYPILLELDCNTEERKAWQEKVRRLLAFLDDGYQTRYHTDLVTIAVVVAVPDQKEADHRRDQLRDWTERVMASEGLRRRGDAFLFSSVPPQSLGEADYFLTPHWRAPFRPDWYPLIDP